METKRYKPLVDGSFFIIWVPTVILLILATVISAEATVALIIMIATDLFTLYFLVSPLFGYVELRESTVYIRLGLIAKREIAYREIRGVEKVRRIYADSMMSLKNSLDHVNIKYNRYDIVSVSVTDNDGLMADINARREGA